MSIADIIEAAAARIDPEAFAEGALAQTAMPVLRRRDEARRKAREVYLVFEAGRAGVLPQRAAA